MRAAVGVGALVVLLVSVSSANLTLAGCGLVVGACLAWWAGLFDPI